MANKKRKGPAQRSKTSYAESLQRKQQLGVEIVAAWTAQLCLDTLAMVLNDSKVMGHDTFGAKRLMRICEAFNEQYAINQQALAKCDEAEYRRVKIDQAQADIFGPAYLHWQERYPYWDEHDTY
jgi:hypothetical protein